jgi:hypothetical protein
VGIKRHERSILLISVAEEPPPDLPGIRNLHIPFVDQSNGDSPEKRGIHEGQKFT